MALGLAQREVSVADAKPGTKMDTDGDGLARNGRAKPDDYSIDLRLVPENAEMESMRASQKGIKNEAATGDGEEAKTRVRFATASGSETAARREPGDKKADGLTAFPVTPATPLVSALGDKLVLSPEVVEFEGFVNHGARIQPPAAGQPASGPASAPSKFLTVSRSGATGQPGRPDDPTVGRIAFWNDDDTAKVNVNPAGGVVGEAADFGTVSGVVTAGVMKAERSQAR